VFFPLALTLLARHLQLCRYSLHEVGYLEEARVTEGMAFFRSLLAGSKINWSAATRAPEAEPTQRPEVVKGTSGWVERGHALAGFYISHRLLVHAVLVTLTWELVAQFVGLIAAKTFPPSNDMAAFFQRHPAFQHGSYPLPLTIWARWDGIWYVLLAAQGYAPQINILDAFFPAFPGLVHVVGVVFGGNYLLAGVLINRVLLLLTVALFAQLVREESGDEAAWHAPLFFLFVPAAVFLLAVYTEVLFLLACIACFLAMRHQRWWLAGLCCALATSTRLPGIVLAGAVLVEGIQQRQFWRGLVAGMVGLAGLAAYALYLLMILRDPLAFQHAYNLGWGDRHLTLNILAAPLQDFQWLVAHWPWQDGSALITLSYEVALVVDCILLLIMWRSLRWSYRVFIVGNMLLPLLSGTLFAYNRYSLVLFPFVLIACRWTATRPNLRQIALLTMGCFSVLNIVLFTASYWVG
jgi:Gpi18-like mannosyltransferase